MRTPIRAIHPVGDRAVLVELDGLTEVLSLHARLQEHPLDGQVDAVAAAATVLVTAVSATAARGFAREIRRRDLSVPVEADDALVTIDTLYDGEDLDDVAEATGLDRDALIAAHTGQVWTAAFGGFAPGFTYLVGEDSRLAVPRRDSPRKAVPAGSVALADTYSSVYPRESPGGWQLIGRTAARMWDLGRDQPALVRPGNRVQFKAVRELVVVPGGAKTDAAPDADPDASGDPERGVIVRAPGVQTTVQDLGRPGFADLGVVAAGALDRGALRRANRLVGNPSGAAVLENALGGLALEAVADEVLAVTGASVSLTVTGADGAVRTVPGNAPFSLHAGERLAVGAPAWGVRCYVAFRGGLDVPLALGSRSTDTMSGIGPAALTDGTRLGVLAAPPGSVVGAAEPAPEPPADVTELRFVPGPRADWFDPASLDEFTRQRWTVTAQSNRIGLRLDGDPVTRSTPGELPSEGTVAGAIQVPASGLPVLFLADHPVTGGYPVLGVVLAADLDKAAQLPAGASIRFTPDPTAGPIDANIDVRARAHRNPKES